MLLSTLGVTAVLSIAAGGLLLWRAHRRWDVETAKLVSSIDAARVRDTQGCYAARELDGLPAPVQRYFRTALKEGAPIVAGVVVEHSGTFNMSETGESWKPFVSRQRVVTRRPGFVWDGRIAMLPGLTAHVHDAYVNGEGILHASIAGLFTVADLRGTMDVAQGELMRFFAEAAWYPTALLPSRGVRWQAVDDRSARASLTDGALSLTLLFRFGEDGLLQSARAEARARSVGKSVVMTPWEGRYSNYQDRDGMRVPLTSEAAWLTPDGRKPYWRGTITSLRYELSE
jgi:uncharacterized protein DUF6920